MTVYVKWNREHEHESFGLGARPLLSKYCPYVFTRPLAYMQITTWEMLSKLCSGNLNIYGYYLVQMETICSRFIAEAEAAQAERRRRVKLDNPFNGHSLDTE